jgi:hypothetical protein
MFHPTSWDNIAKPNTRFEVQAESALRIPDGSFDCGGGLMPLQEKQLLLHCLKLSYSRTVLTVVNGFDGLPGEIFGHCY